MVRRTRKATGACCTSTLCSAQLPHWELPYWRSITFGRDWSLVWNEESSGGICIYFAPFMVAIYVARPLSKDVMDNHVRRTKMLENQPVNLFPP
jgi:hypothetical protein